MERDNRSAAATAGNAAKDGESASRRIGDDCSLDADESYVSSLMVWAGSWGVFGGWQAMESDAVVVVVASRDKVQSTE
jgi:hypothetical protein